ncbi:MAG: hypothetical protein WC678_03715 [Parcubacteria group bacterium]|jgi:hypothetical protein
MSFRRHIILEFEIFIGAEEYLEDINLPEPLISFFVFLMRIMEVVFIFVGGFLSIIFFSGLTFALAWMISKLIAG